MADNYLEKQMEDYRAGRFSGRRNIGLPSGEVALLFAAEVGGISDRILQLRHQNFRVAFCCPKSVEATRFVQANSCRYYPFDPSSEDVRRKVREDVMHRWGRLDIEEALF